MRATDRESVRRGYPHSYPASLARRVSFLIVPALKFTRRWHKYYNKCSHFRSQVVFDSYDVRPSGKVDASKKWIAFYTSYHIIIFTTPSHVHLPLPQFVSDGSGMVDPYGPRNARTPRVIIASERRFLGGFNPIGCKEIASSVSTWRSMK